MWYQLLLCLFIIGMLWYVKDDGKKTKFVLPFSFILITLFFALRYEYGNDYWHYYLRWDSGRLVEGDNRGTGETLFYGFMQQGEIIIKESLGDGILKRRQLLMIICD